VGDQVTVIAGGARREEQNSNAIHPRDAPVHARCGNILGTHEKQGWLARLSRRLASNSRLRRLSTAAAMRDISSK